MGNESAKIKKDKKNSQQIPLKNLDKVKLDVACLKVKGYLELNRDRRINQALQKEKVLIQCVRSPQRARMDEYQKLSSLVADVNYVEACNLVMRCVDIIKDQSIKVCQSYGDPARIPELMPFIETILWSSSQLNLQTVQEFRDLIVVFFGASVYDPDTLQSVDPELKNLFKSSVGDAGQINTYALMFAEKYGITIEQLNAPGHMFSPQLLQQQQQKGYVNQQAMNQPNQFGQDPNNYGLNLDRPSFPQYNQVQQPNIIYQNPNNPSQNNSNNNFNQQQQKGGTFDIPAYQQQSGGRPNPSYSMPSGVIGQMPYGNQGSMPFVNQGFLNQDQQSQGLTKTPQSILPSSKVGNQSNDNFVPPQDLKSINVAPESEASPLPFNGGGGGSNPYGQLKLAPSTASNQLHQYQQPPQFVQSNLGGSNPNNNQSNQVGLQANQGNVQPVILGNPMGDNDLDDLQARFNRLKDNL